MSGKQTFILSIKCWPLFHFVLFGNTIKLSEIISSPFLIVWPVLNIARGWYKKEKEELKFFFEFSTIFRKLINFRCQLQKNDHHSTSYWICAANWIRTRVPGVSRCKWTLTYWSNRTTRTNWTSPPPSTELNTILCWDNKVHEIQYNDSGQIVFHAQIELKLL